MTDMPTDFLTWLEEGAQFLMQSRPTTAGIVGLLPDGSAFTAYYHANAQDKALLAHHIYSDAMLEIVLANADQLREALENG